MTSHKTICIEGVSVIVSNHTARMIVITATKKFQRKINPFDRMQRKQPTKPEAGRLITSAQQAPAPVYMENRDMKQTV
ncbi:hypothetical protein HBH64_135310 [Parastagonospora nodorum]|nr:hypothetical protein HBI01_076450 [Parastagonospora nodorum]KAH4317856.1 hypothetical protein HBI02_024340 [Parastagonospora nodorum]KAH4330162.1 hypothetical protein HBI00_086590 [Parastagonospora nodorum]KAH4392792.1 hypothetical protein HBH94_003210 [Parastagonospora nodorum]KAH4505969.1 hypothetical protein HBH88_053210 [Parastagonospora nodorum]